MATQTLAEAGKLVNDEIAAGVVETIVDLNTIISHVPFRSFSGQALVVNAEATIGDSANYAVGDTITANAAGTYSQKTFTSIKIIGDADMDTLVAATGGIAEADLIKSKAKSVSRTMQNQMINGTGVAPVMSSLFSQVTAGQSIDAAGATLTIEMLYELIDQVKAKDGKVDFILMSKVMKRKLRVILNALGGNNIDNITLPNGLSVDSFENIPVFTSDYKAATESLDGTALTGGVYDSIYAGCFDEGDNSGITFVYPEAIPAGIAVRSLGEQEDLDGTRTRIAFYGNFASTNDLGLARLFGIALA